MIVLLFTLFLMLYMFHSLLIFILVEYPCVATGTHNTMITYIQNVSILL
jgi:hypothetical protein